MAPDRLSLLFVSGTLIVVLDGEYEIKPPEITVSDEHFAKLIQQEFEPEPFRPSPVAGKNLPKDWKERQRRNNQSYKSRGR